MRSLSFRLLLVSAVLALSTIRCSTSSNLLGAASPLITTLTGNSTLSTMAGLLQTPGLDKLLGSSLKSPFTLLAPTNDAFSALGSSAISSLTKPENLTNLANVLKGHIVPGKIDVAGLAKSGLTTAAGSALNLGSAKPGTLIGGKDFNIIPIDKVLQ